MTDPRRTNARVSRIQREIHQRLGVCPSPFLLAAESPEMMENLWKQTCFAYLDNPIPALFKEKLFAYLSRFCNVSYCLARHSAFLVGRGNVGGDPSCPPMPSEAVLSMLKTPVPNRHDIDVCIDELGKIAGPLDDWPEPGSELDSILFTAALPLFLRQGEYQRLQTELRRVLGAKWYDLLTAFLSFIRSVHYWTETHGDIKADADVEQMLDEEHRLAAWLRCYRGVVQDELNDLIEMEIARLKDVHSAELAATEELENELAKQSRLLSVASSTVIGAAETRERDEQKFQDLFEASTDGIILVKPDGTLSLVSEEVEHQFGYDRDELLSHHFEMLIPERFRDKHREHQGSLLRQPGAATERKASGTHWDAKRWNGIPR